MAKNNRKIIISCAITGSVHTPTMSEYLPITPSQIVDSAVEAAEAGAAILHIHAREPEAGRPTGDPAHFREICPVLAERTNAIINITTGGSSDMRIEQRLAYPLQAKPEMCSRFVLSMVYKLPSPSHSHLMTETLGGWSVATATLIQDGRQESIGYTATNNVYGNQVDRASFAAGCTAKDLPTKGSLQSRINGYVNSKCLSTPAVIGDDGIATDYGNTPNGVLRGVDQVNADISLAKTFQARWPREGAYATFRTDFFNAFNHPNFGDPNLGYTGPTGSAFGTITGMSTNPRIIQFSLKLGF